MVQRLTARHVGIIVCCCIQCGIPVAIIISAAGLFYPIIAADLGVQTAEVSAWMSVAMLSSAVFSPIVGNLLSRVRLKTMRILGIALAGAVMLLFSMASAPWMLWVGGAMAGFTLVVLTALGPATLVNRWFEKRVGAIMGVYAAFTGIGGVVFLLLGQAIIDASGWRTAYLAFAVMSWAVGLPVELLLNRERPGECGLLPYGALQGGDDAQDAAARRSDAGNGADVVHQANRAMRAAPFWLLIVCGFLMNTVCQINGYFPKYVMWIDEQAAAGLMAGAFITGAVLASVCQAGNALGKLGLGLFSDFSVRNATIALAVCGVAGVACIWMLPATFLMAAGGLVFGFFIAGVLVLMPMLCREIFGTGEVYPVLYARIAVAPTLGGAAGNILWPYLADNLGGFDAVFGCAITFIGFVLLCALLALRTAKR
jgi:MFS family permease